MTYRIGMVAGEASGDALGAQVIHALSSQRHSDVDTTPRCLQIEGVGGSAMVAAGCHNLADAERLAVMGLVQPLARLPELLSIRRRVYRHFTANPPDVFLSIDAPDFNLPLARRLRRQGIPTVHLVSPSVWAWRRGRLRTIAQAVDIMLCLFPFETAVYAEQGIEHAFVGHPLADETPMSIDRTAAREQLSLPPKAKVLALLPGSRVAEVTTMAPLLLQAARIVYAQHGALSMVLPVATAACRAPLQAALSACPDLPVTLCEGQASIALAAADAALVTSGTATLEAALNKTPMVVAYKTGALNWALLSRLVETEFVALPNLLAGKALVPELLQHSATPEALAAAVKPLLYQPQDTLTAQFADIHRRLRRECATSVARILWDRVQPSGER